MKVRRHTLKWRQQAELDQSRLWSGGTNVNTPFECFLHVDGFGLRRIHEVANRPNGRNRYQSVVID